MNISKERALLSMHQAKFIGIIATALAFAALSIAGIVILATVYVAYSEKLQVHKCLMHVATCMYVSLRVLCTIP